MAAILKRIRKSSLSSSVPRHEKLLEEPGPGDVDPILQGVHFKVKYIGSCPVSAESGEEVTANAIKCILATAKRLEKKLPRVDVTVSLAGVSVIEQEAMQCLHDLPIDSISYCSADPTSDHVFAVICTSEEGLNCHAFLTPKRKMAESATLTIAQAFNLAYELWKTEQPNVRRRDISPKAPPNSLVVTQAVVEPVPSSPTSPGQANNNLPTRSPTPGTMKTQNLLLDFRNVSLSSCSEKKVLWEGLEDVVETGGRNRGVSESSTSWVQFGDEEEEGKKIHKSQFERPRESLAMLSVLPSNSLSLDLAAFSTSPNTTGWDSPLGSTPRNGFGLTPSQLSSPVGSPLISTPPATRLLDFQVQVSSPPRGSCFGTTPTENSIPPLSWPV